MTGDCWHGEVCTWLLRSCSCSGVDCSSPGFAPVCRPDMPAKNAMPACEAGPPPDSWVLRPPSKDCSDSGVCCDSLACWWRLKSGVCCDCGLNMCSEGYSAANVNVSKPPGLMLRCCSSWPAAGCGTGSDCVCSTCCPRSTTVVSISASPSGIYQKATIYPNDHQEVRVALSDLAHTVSCVRAVSLVHPQRASRLWAS